MLQQYPTPSIPQTVEAQTEEERHRAKLKAIEGAAYPGCGQVYELWQGRVQAAIEGHAARLPADEAARFLRLAAAESDYDPNGPGDDETGDGDTCVHGLDWMTCPCGCFERD